MGFVFNDFLYASRTPDILTVSHINDHSFLHVLESSVFGPLVRLAFPSRIISSNSRVQNVDSTLHNPLYCFVVNQRVDLNVASANRTALRMKHVFGQALIAERVATASVDTLNQQLKADWTGEVGLDNLGLLV